MCQGARNGGAKISPTRPAIQKQVSVKHLRLSRGELVARLHRSPAYLERRAVLASLSVTSGAPDNCPVAIQSCRMTSVRKQLFLAPTRSAWREN